MSASKNSAGLYELEIDGEKYEFEKWGADEGVDVLLDIARIVGKPLGMAIGSLMGSDEDGNKGADKSFNPDVIAQIMEALSQSLDKATCKVLIKKLSSEKIYCNGAPIKFNLHYQDRYSHLMKVVSAATEVQFGNFFGAVLGVAGVKMPSKITNRVPQTFVG